MYLLIYFRSAAMLKDMKTESKWVRYMIYEGSNTVYFHRFFGHFYFLLGDYGCTLKNSAKSETMHAKTLFIMYMLGAYREWLLLTF